MKARSLFKIILLLMALLLSVMILILPVSTRQGINYSVRTIKIPLYIKAIEFLDRDYHYKELVKRITQGCKSEKDRVMALFEWTHRNIKRDIPEGWPIVDDHVWHIIVRGYGVSDQLSDVFTTLCNYAGVEAFFTCVYGSNQTGRIPLSFLKIEGKWCIFDPFNGSYFKNKNGEFADIEELKSGSNWSIESLNGKPGRDYAVYFANLTSVEKIGLTRANIQSPLNRLLFELKKVEKRFQDIK